MWSITWYDRSLGMIYHFILYITWYDIGLSLHIIYNLVLVTWCDISLGMIYHLEWYITWYDISLHIIYHLVWYITSYDISHGMIYHLVWYITWYGISLYIIHVYHLGAVHKVRHAIFGQFLPLPLSQFVTHPGTPPESTSHISDPPRFLEGLVQKT